MTTHIQGLSDQMVELLKYPIHPDFLNKSKSKKQRQSTLPASYMKLEVDISVTDVNGVKDIIPDPPNKDVGIQRYQGISQTQTPTKDQP